MPPSLHTSVGIPEFICFDGVKPTKTDRRDRLLNSAVTTGTDIPAESELVKLILESAGLKRNSYRKSSLLRRVPACLRYLGVETEGQACEKVRAQPKLTAALVDILLIGVTGFFRDLSVFQSLESQVIPQITRTRPLRVWSAACSYGQELYSLAVLLSNRGFHGQSELLGTDVRASAVARAVRGVYPRENAEGLPERWAKHLLFDGDRLEVSHELRRSCTWKVADMFKGIEPGPWDIILWRNMAVFLEDSQGSALWHVLYEQLSPGGFIVTGTADYPPPRLPLQPLSRCVFQRPG